MFEILPFFQKLTPPQRALLEQHTRRIHCEKGRSIHNSGDCTGLIGVASGQLRAYINSESGKEITLYRLLEGDVCILAASCVLRNLNFEINIMAEKESDILVLPSAVFEKLSAESTDVRDFASELVASRFSEVMWIVEQIAFHSLDKRLAGYLLDQVSLEGALTLPVTHEMIARDLGTAREVVSRLLKYFSSEGLIEQSRNAIKIVDQKRLRELSK